MTSVRRKQNFGGGTFLTSQKQMTWLGARYVLQSKRQLVCNAGMQRTHTPAAHVSTMQSTQSQSAQFHACLSAERVVSRDMRISEPPLPMEQTRKSAWNDGTVWNVPMDACICTLQPERVYLSDIPLYSNYWEYLIFYQWEWEKELFSLYKKGATGQDTCMGFFSF